MVFIGLVSVPDSLGGLKLRLGDLLLGLNRFVAMVRVGLIHRTTGSDYRIDSGNPANQSKQDRMGNQFFFLSIGKHAIRLME